MSGETEEHVSGWTVDTLHSHVVRVLQEMDRRYEQRAIDSEKMTAAALIAAKEAVTKAEAAQDKRLDGMNEIRSSLDDATRANVARTEWSTAHAAVVDAINELKSRFEKFEARSSGTTAGAEATKTAATQLRTLIVGSAGVVIAAIGVAVAIMVATR